MKSRVTSEKRILDPSLAVAEATLFTESMERDTCNSWFLNVYAVTNARRHHGTILLNADPKATLLSEHPKCHFPAQSNYLGSLCFCALSYKIRLIIVPM